jgi:hypothetical protein
MVQSKVTFSQMQVEGAFMDPAESDEPGFRIAPESFSAIPMRAASHKFILAMIDAEMFAVAHIDQANYLRHPYNKSHCPRRPYHE